MKRKAKKTASSSKNGKTKTIKKNSKAKTSLLSKLLIQTMKNNGKSIRELAKEAGLSPTIIQKIRTGQQTDVKLNNFINIFQACGYELSLTKGKERISLG